MNNILKNTLILTLLFLSIEQHAQNLTSNTFGKGIGIMAKDSSYSMKISTRFQTLYVGTTETGSNNWESQMLIRRARLKFDGYAFSPKLIYKIELGLSNRDHGNGIPETRNTAGLILDAVLKYEFAKGWELWAGQTKLPGNRERVISSQKLQFVDRSLVNSRFTLDRDIGVQLHNSTNIGPAVLKFIGSISMGEGRNITDPNKGGYDYTIRTEILPFGEFKSNGDYFGSDLKREETPKLSMAVTYDFNDGASRQRGQLGSFMKDQNNVLVMADLSTIFADMMFKYKGFSMMSEYANRVNKTGVLAITGPASTRKFYSGQGLVAQAGYLIPSNYEFALRYTTIMPDDTALSGLPRADEYTVGFSKYFSEHNFKIQSDVSLIQVPGANDEYRVRLQCELSF